MDTVISGSQCCFSPLVDLWGISLLALLQPLAPIYIKLIRQKKEAKAGTNHFWIIEATKQAICPGKIKAHPSPILSTLTHSPFPPI